MFVVLDLDKTLANTEHRIHHTEKTPKDWDAFLDPGLVIKDKVIAGAERVLTHFEDLRYTFVILTERHEGLRDTTMRWMQENLNINVPDTHLLMRPIGNMLNAAEFKREQLLNFRQGLENKDTDFLIIDDDAAVAIALKDLGVVLKAPECWKFLFPIPEPVENQD
jgi:predicted secreted acid phosphatase